MSDLSEPSPAWGGASTDPLNDGASHAYLPESDGSHPDGSGLDPEIWDAFVLCDDPASGGGLHYLARYEWQGSGNKSCGVVYQYNNNTFELLSDLNNFYENSPTTYPDYGPIAPCVKFREPSVVGIAVWEHVKYGTNDHYLRLRVLKRSGATGAAGTWTFETVTTIGPITDADTADAYKYDWDAGINDSAGAGSTGGAPHVDYAFDQEGNEHIVWSVYDSTGVPYNTVYWSYKDNTVATPSWSAPLKISIGSAWSSFIDSGLKSAIYSLAILKDNGHVPSPTKDLRVVWNARTYLGTGATFIGGVRIGYGEDQIEIYAPEVFMNDRDDTAGPEDMLWP